MIVEEIVNSISPPLPDLGKHVHALRKKKPKWVVPLALSCKADAIGFGSRAIIGVAPVVNLPVVAPTQLQTPPLRAGEKREESNV